ncbi:MAG: hypothetical protein AVDCRST_MAG87-867, partial [uncultured Thermomicrobiales bacterium]
GIAVLQAGYGVGLGRSTRCPTSDTGTQVPIPSTWFRQARLRSRARHYYPMLPIGYIEPRRADADEASLPRPHVLHVL